MTLERLKNYRFLVMNIMKLEEQLAVIDAKLTQTTKPLSDMPKNKTPKDLTNDLLAQRVDMETLINKKMVEGSIEVAQVNEAILGLENCEQYLFRARYLEGKTWDNIATELNYSLAGVFKIHSRAAKEQGW